LGQFLKHNPDKRVEITGHTDDTGPADFNYLLSQARANAVADYLKGKGVSITQLSVKGYGAKKPFSSSPAVKANNRRVEITILNQPGF
jgi:outer membrane protein OmpA-like peptidoglycan-associated protein